MASKRKRVVLSITTKHEILQKLESGESAAKLAQIYGIGKATISGIKSQKYAIENYMLNAEFSDAPTSRKSLMVPKNKNVDTAVFQWFLQNKEKGIPVSGPMLCGKAREINEKLKGDPNFKASSGWLGKFKSRHGIRELSTSSERCPIDNIAGEAFTLDFNKFLEEEGYMLQNVYKASKVELEKKVLTEETLGFCENNNERVTTLLCANATGCHKLPVLIIGKDKNLQYFKDINIDVISIVYKNQNGWNNEIFSDWFETVFVPAIKKDQLKDGRKQNTLLLIDDIRLQSMCDILNRIDEFIKVMYLPPSLSPFVQPMDQGLIECFKKLCRENLHHKFLLTFDDKEGDENLNLKECCYVENAWSNITNSMLKRTWMKLSSHNLKETVKQETVSQNIDETITALCKTSGYQEFNRIDEKKQLQLNKNSSNDTYSVNSDNVNNILNCKVEVKEECSGSDDEDVPSHIEAFIALKKGVKWLEAQKECNYIQLTLLRNLCNLAAKKIWNP